MTVRRDAARARAVAIALAVLCSPTASSALVEIEGETEATLSWADATGPVAGYFVYVSRNGGPQQLYSLVGAPSETIAGEPGDTLVVTVAAFDASGEAGPLSPPSETFRFVATEPPPDHADEDLVPGTLGDLYSEDFESYRRSFDPDGWIDTASGSSLAIDPALFQTFEIAGWTVYGTASPASDIHSHFTSGASASWAGYEFSGRVVKTWAIAGIGMTIYSEFPASDRYYGLRAPSGATFALASHPESGAPACIGATDTGVRPERYVWYRFRLQAYDTAGGTRIRAKVWDERSTEPPGWSVDCVDPARTYVSGRPGLWSSGQGARLWDDLAVSTLVAADPATQTAGPSDPVTQSGASSDPTTAQYADDFDSHAPGSDPPDWLDTGPNGSLGVDDAIFETLELADGNVVFGTVGDMRQVQSHLVREGTGAWSAYEFSGRMAATDRDGRLGVAIYSQFPEAARSYLLRTIQRRFAFSQDPATGPCIGGTDTGVRTREGRWYRFRVQAFPAADGTRLRAKVWDDVEPEPAGWQAECVDPDETLSAGRPGLWASGPGEKYWDDLAVEPLELR